MALNACTSCTTKFAVGLPRCPQCGSTEFVEDGQPMAKITAHGGPSDKTLPDAVVQTNAVLTEEQAEELRDAVGAGTEQLPFQAAVESTPEEGGEESSPGTSSSTSTETQPPKSEPSSKPRRKPARKTESPSEPDPTESSTAPSTAGQKTAATSAADDK
ncbi:hypothetical protein [Streptomyces sp. YIM S03343]